MSPQDGPDRRDDLSSTRKQLGNERDTPEVTGDGTGDETKEEAMGSSD